MNKNYRPIIFMAIVLTTGVVLFEAVSLFFKYEIDEPYKRFQAEERVAYEQFNLLNQQVFDSVPVPTGVQELDRTVSHGQSTAYGRTLEVRYKIVDTTYEKVLADYRDHFNSHAWKTYYFIPPNDKTLYYLEDACFQITFAQDGFEIEIAHNYFGQEFTPVLPSKLSLDFNEFGETTFLRCPPIWYDHKYNP